MEANLKNKIGFFLFFFLVLFLGVGGYFFTDYMLQKEVCNKENKIEEKKDYRIDKNKDYIYFINSETISEGAEIYYQDVVINLSTQEVLTETLEKENRIYKESIKYIDDEDVYIMSEDLINYNNDNIYSLTFREYQTYSYGDYVSLIINDYNYTCFDLVTFNKSKSYVFDTTNGNVINESDLLNLYHTNIDSIKSDIREYLNSKQEIVDEEEYLKIDDTLNNFTNYALYIDNVGNLYISFLVKTSKQDYNEIMEVN